MEYLDDEKYILLAYKEAQKAYKKLEAPIGAVIVKNNIVIAKAHNLREYKNNSLAHAEILCINKACKKLKSLRLDGCEMYVTLEPCPMCAGAIIQSRISKVYIGTKDLKNGAVGSVINLLESNFTSKVQYEYANKEINDKCSLILKDFFKELRNKNKVKYLNK